MHSQAQQVFPATHQAALGLYVCRPVRPAHTLTVHRIKRTLKAPGAALAPLIVNPAQLAPHRHRGLPHGLKLPDSPRAGPRLDALRSAAKKIGLRRIRHARRVIVPMPLSTHGAGIVNALGDVLCDIA
jgi:hypothetical protein